MITVTFTKEDIVSSEVAKLLKKKGFKDWCGQCYTTAVMHNGEPIDFDEECELKDEGYGDEIEYIDGGVLFNGGYTNKEDFGAYAAPSLTHAVKWLEKNDYILYVYPSYDKKCSGSSTFGLTIVPCFLGRYLNMTTTKCTTQGKKQQRRVLSTALKNYCSYEISD